MIYGLPWWTLAVLAAILVAVPYVMVMSRRRHICGHSKVNLLHNGELCKHLAEILPSEDASWRQRRFFARKQEPLLAFVRWPLKSAGIFNPGIIEAQYRAITEALGSFVWWVYAAPWAAALLTAAIGAGGGGYAYLDSRSAMENTARTLTSFTEGHLTFVIILCTLFGFFLGMGWSRRIKYNMAYGWGLVLETGDPHNPWSVTAALSSNYPRLAFAQLHGYFRGSSRHSGLRNGFLMMRSRPGQRLQDMPYRDALGRPCAACVAAETDNPDCDNPECLPPLPAMDGSAAEGKEAAGGKTVERFTNRNAETLYSWMFTVAEAARLSKAIERKSALDVIKGAGPWIATGCFIVGTILVLSMYGQAAVEQAAAERQAAPAAPAVPTLGGAAAADMVEEAVAPAAAPATPAPTVGYPGRIPATATPEPAGTREPPGGGR